MKWIIGNTLHIITVLSFISWIAGIVVLVLADSFAVALAGFFLILPGLIFVQLFFGVAQSGQNSSTLEKLAALSAMTSASNQDQERPRKAN